MSQRNETLRGALSKAINRREHSDGSVSWIVTPGDGLTADEIMASILVAAVPAGPQMVDHPDYFPNTDYERGYADGSADAKRSPTPPSPVNEGDAAVGEPLDEDRLARAIERVRAGDEREFGDSLLWQYDEDVLARQIAREYAALAEPQP